MRPLGFIVLLALVAAIRSFPINHQPSIHKANVVAVASFNVPDGQVNRSEISSFLYLLKDVLIEKIFDSKSNSASKSTRVAYSTIGFTLVASCFLRQFN